MCAMHTVHVLGLLGRRQINVKIVKRGGKCLTRSEMDNLLKQNDREESCQFSKKDHGKQIILVLFAFYEVFESVPCKLWWCKRQLKQCLRAMAKRFCPWNHSNIPFPHLETLPSHSSETDIRSRTAGIVRDVIVCVWVTPPDYLFLFEGVFSISPVLKKREIYTVFRIINAPNYESLSVSLAS